MSGHEDVRAARAALARLVEPGHRELGLLVRDVGPVAALDRLRDGTVSERLHLAVKARRGETDPLDVARQDLARCERLGARLVIPEDEEWPAVLDDLVDISTGDEPHVLPPLCLWARGPGLLSALTERAVSVVGARAATPYGNHVASEIGYGLADRGWTVVSGGAYGVDASAHRGALGGGGPTIAVMACGVDTPYPVGHTNLFERIAEDGLLLSEWPPGTSPYRHRFLVRNRVIAALSRGTVVVEAASRSGTRMTARRAQELGRVVMAVPGPVTSAMSVGPHELVRDFGARLVGSSSQVIEEVGQVGEALGSPVAESRLRRDDLEPRAARILDAVPARKAVRLEQVAADAGLPARDVRRTMPTLMLMGLVEEVVSGYRLTALARAELATRPVAATPDLR